MPETIDKQNRAINLPGQVRWTLLHDPGMMRLINHMLQSFLEFKDEIVGPPDGRHQTLVVRTHRRLDNLTVQADLDAWRLEMATRTELLIN